MTEDEAAQLIEELTVSTVAAIRAEAETNLQHVREVREGFNERLRNYWATPLDLYCLLSAGMQEVGSDIVRRNAGTTSALLQALSGTHAKACRVADEVYVLLTNGHGAGAVARCRTLHEFSVIAAVLSKYDGSTEVPDICERYLNDGGWTREDGNYGWASEIGGKKQTTFVMLEEAAGIGHLRPEYRAANHEIHADTTGLWSNLFSRGEDNYALAGPTNAFLSRPGQMALIYLHQVTTALNAAFLDVTDLVFVQALKLLLDEACVAFDAAERAVERAEEELQERLSRGEDS